MAFRPRRNRRSGRVARKRPNRRTTRPKVSAALKTYVKKAIHRNLENKVYFAYGANQSLTTSIAAPPQSINLMPALVQGGGQNNRIGQEVKIVSAQVKGYVNILPYSATLNPLSTPVYVKIWCVSSKLTNSYNLPDSKISTNFFETGVSTTGMQGNILDLMFTPNKDCWTVHGVKTFSIGATSATTTGAVSTGGYYDNSKMSLPFSFSYGKHFKSMLKYTDDTVNTNSFLPWNKNCWLLFQSVYADGSSSSVNSAEFHYATKVEYEDA